MGVVIVTGSNGLVGSEVSRHFCELGYRVIGIDNNLRMQFFGQDGDTRQLRAELINSYPNEYKHLDVDIRSIGDLQKIFDEFEMWLTKCLPSTKFM